MFIHTIIENKCISYNYHTVETWKTWSRGLKHFFMLNSIEHKIAVLYKTKTEKKIVLLQNSQTLYLSY